VPLLKLPLTAAVEDGVLSGGFNNTADACLVDGEACEEPEAYAWWDTFHPTTALHAQMAATLAASVEEQLQLLLVR